MLTYSLFTLVLASTLVSANDSASSLVKRQFGGQLGPNGNVTWPIQAIPYEDEGVPANCTEPCEKWKKATRKGACAIALPKTLPVAVQASALPDGSKLSACPMWTMRNEDLCAAVDVQAECIVCAFPELNVTSPEYIAAYGGMVEQCKEQGHAVPEKVPGIDMQNLTAGGGTPADTDTLGDQMPNPPPSNTPAVAATGTSGSSSSSAAPSPTSTSSAARRWPSTGLALGITTLAVVTLL